MIAPFCEPCRCADFAALQRVYERHEGWGVLMLASPSGASQALVAFDYSPLEARVCSRWLLCGCLLPGGPAPEAAA